MNQAHNVYMENPIVMVWLPVVLILVMLSVWGYSLVDFSRTDESEMRTFPKEVWLLILVLGSCVGAVIWIAAGRPQRH